MTAEEAALILAIQFKRNYPPEADALAGLYADWLEDQDRIANAAWVRAEVKERQAKDKEEIPYAGDMAALFPGGVFPKGRPFGWCVIDWLPWITEPLACGGGQ